MSVDPQELSRLDRLAFWLDNAVRIPGTNIRVGLDGFLGLIPGVGDVAASLMSFYIISKAIGARLPLPVIGAMVGNVVLELLVGSIPLLGDIFDFAWKANTKNVALIKQHSGIKRHSGVEPKPST